MNKTLLLLFTFAIAEDEYPYFNDSVKQMKFEKQKISIDVNSNIRIDNIKFDLEEFFGIIGLDEDKERVGKINKEAKNKYELSMQRYQLELEKATSKREEGLLLYRNDSIKYVQGVKQIKDSLSIARKKYNKTLTISWIITGISYILLVDDIHFVEGGSDLDSNIKLAGTYGGVLFSLLYGLFKEPIKYQYYNEKPIEPHLYKYLPKIPDYPKTSIPDYGYSIETLINLAESYNRKVYKKIKTQ